MRMKHASPFPDLIAAIEAHCAKAGIAESTFGAMALNDPNFVRNLRDGREPRRRTADRAIDFILTGKTYMQARASQENHTGDAA